VLAAARNGQNGSGRLAVALLGQAAIAQARRLGEDLADPLTITAADIPDQVALRGPAAEGPGSGLYLLGGVARPGRWPGSAFAPAPRLPVSRAGVVPGANCQSRQRC
jgi:hypothetical protein